MNTEHLLTHLDTLRANRQQIVTELLTSGDPEAVNLLLADMINGLEALFLLINAEKFTPEGFQSLDPANARDNNA